MAESEGDAFQPARSGMIEIANLTFTYPYGTTPGLESLNLTIPQGQVILLTGVSGCGKSTLVRCLNGLIPHLQGRRYSGTIRIDGSEIANTPIRDLATKVGVVFQQSETQLFNLTVAAVSRVQRSFRHRTHRRLQQVTDRG